MRKNGIDKLAFLVVLGAAVVVAVVAVGTAPAYSDDAPTDPAEVHSTTGTDAPSGEIAPADPVTSTPDSARYEATPDPEGYEWSGSRPADQRYLWSHRPN